MNAKFRTYSLHLLLFIASVITTTLVGAENVTGKVWLGWGMIPPEMLLSFADFSKGIPYSLAFLTFLSVHEFGHYFTAMYHNVKSSLPYYIPIWIPFPGLLNIGSFGAIIKIQQPPDTTRKFFDIGVAGPLAGFVVSLCLVIGGLLTLPDKDYILTIHPEYQTQFAGVPTTDQQIAYITQYNTEHPDAPLNAYYVGENLLVKMLRYLIPHNPQNYPTPFELIHYPLLFVGFLTLFFTALNLLPIGQLDGGHVIYGLFGIKNAAIVSRVTVIVLLFVGGTGFADIQNIQDNIYVIAGYLLLLVYVCHHVFERPSGLQTLVIALVILAIQGIWKGCFPATTTSPIWLTYAFLAIRAIGLKHPPAVHEHSLDRNRKILGWIAIVIFVLTFTPNPISIFE